mmetsp:Transcript_2087/g.6222  ORF Transcript_2087/g.6222 Transcript_2087/m.6222 type:complete len:91 (+) Transcript_2087:1801-2073(+)
MLKACFGVCFSHTEFPDGSWGEGKRAHDVTYGQVLQPSSYCEVDRAEGKPEEVMTGGNVMGHHSPQFPLLRQRWIEGPSQVALSARSVGA